MMCSFHVFDVMPVAAAKKSSAQKRALHVEPKMMKRGS
jgi:hypothetical protein